MLYIVRADFETGWYNARAATTGVSLWTTVETLQIPGSTSATFIDCRVPGAISSDGPWTVHSHLLDSNGPPLTWGVRTDRHFTTAPCRKPVRVG